MAPQSGPDQSGPDIGPLARKLQRLIDLKRKPSGETFSNTEIAEACSRLYVEDKISSTRARMETEGATAADVTDAVTAIRAAKPLMHRTYVSDLRNGRRSNPSQDKLHYLALFFGVSPVYFFDGEEADDVEAEVELITTFRQLKKQLEDGGEEDAQEMLTAMFRGANELSPAMAKGILSMHLTAIEQARRVEKGEPPART